MSDTKPGTAPDPSRTTRSYRAITRHSDGRIIHVWDIHASSNAEAIRIVRDRGEDIRTDLYSEDGLIWRFGMQEP